MDGLQPHTTVTRWSQFTLTVNLLVNFKDKLFFNLSSVHNTLSLRNRCFTVQIDNDPKHAAKASQEFLKAKRWNIKSDPNLTELLKAEISTNKQQMKITSTH